MFRATLCPSSRAYQLQQQPLVYRRNVVVAVLLAVIGPVGKSEAAAAAIDRLLMTGIRMAKTCRAVSKRQTVNL
jgi:hypothetical protein